MLHSKAASSRASCAHRCFGSTALQLGGSFGRRTAVRAMAAAPQPSLTCSAAELPAALKKLEALPAPRFVVFSSDPDPVTGQPWCPDCVRAVPAVVRVCAEKKASLLLCNVGARADWKTPAHPFRTDPALQLKGIPTLIEWDGGKPGRRLGPELEAAASPADAVALVAAFLTTAK